MRVMLQLREDAARELQEQSGRSAGSQQRESDTQELLNAAAELGVRLEPVHPGQTHPLLTPHFLVEIPNREAAQRVIDKLSRFKTVEAAYLKPDDELP
jgi:hypothetical protein